MLSVYIVIHVFHQCFHMIVISGLQLLPYRVLFKFEMIVIIVRVAKHVAQYFDGLADIVLE
jgi:hypothetical protein